ncbi:hypothetical protein Tco_0959833 [Tanacetum coccineum]
MLLLLVQGKLTNLSLDERYALNVALRMYTRRIVIQERVEDLQLAVESYQKKINLTRPDTTRPDLRKMTPYTSYLDVQGIIYQDKLGRNRLMRTDELHKFSDLRQTRLLGIIAVISLKIMKFFGYSHLEEITVRRQDDVLYKFREGDFKRLRRQDIKDMLLLLVQGSITHPLTPG